MHTVWYLVAILGVFPPLIIRLMLHDFIVVHLCLFTVRNFGKTSHCNKHVVSIVIFLSKISPFGILVLSNTASSKMNWYWRLITISGISSIQNTKLMDKYFSFVIPKRILCFFLFGKVEFSNRLHQFHTYIRLLRLCWMLKSIVTTFDNLFY